MNELRISGHSNVVIGTKQIFRREKIEEEEEEAWRVTVSRREKKKIEKNWGVVGFRTSYTQNIFFG